MLPKAALCGHCFCKSVPARIFTRVDCSLSPCSCVNSSLDVSLPSHTNIILQNILSTDLSKVPLNRGWTLYLFSHITKYISGGVESHTFKESQRECLLLLERWFLSLWYLVVQQEMERNEWWPGGPCRQVWTDGEWGKSGVEFTFTLILNGNLRG